MVYLILLFVLIAVPLIAMLVSGILSGIIVGSVGAIFMGLFRLFGKKEILPYNADIFPIIPEDDE